MYYSSERQQQRIDLRDSIKNDYYDREPDESENMDRDVGKSLARVAARTSSDNSPSPISDVYFVGKLHLHASTFGFLILINEHALHYAYLWWVLLYV